MAKHMPEPTFTPVWHFPDPKASWDKRLPQVVHCLHREYGMPVELTTSPLFANHFTIAVPKHHARRAENVISDNFSRF